MKVIHRISLTLAIICLTCNLHAQSIEDASALFARKELDSALVIVKKIIEHDKSAVLAYVMAGRVLVAKNNFIEATKYLEKSLSLPGGPLYAEAWAKAELGPCYFFNGDYKKAKESLAAAIDLNATKNSTSAAKQAMFKLGLDKFYDSWTTIETTHFIFHFQDTTSFGNVSRFIKMKEAAFDSINSFLRAKLPKKIDYFTWNDSHTGEMLLRHSLAFTDDALCVTHTEKKHTIGHEMTHSISSYAVHHTSWSRLINEGVCVYFDMSTKHNIEKLKENAAGPISIVDIWKSSKKADDGIIYPLGGEIVKRLIETSGREKFMELLADQSYESAKRIYGAELETIIKKLEAEINL